MRQLRTGGRVVALLALLGLAAGCGSVPGSSAATAVKATAVKGAAATTRAAGAAATGPAGISASEVIADKEHGIVPPVKSGAFVKHADLLNGVSCAGPQCVAVGTYYYGTSGHTLVELWTGEAWRLEPVPGRPRDGGIGVTWSGGHWRIVFAPGNFGPVSCPGTDACVAVATATRTPVFATWNGTTWHTGVMHAPPPQAQELNLADVTCTSADNCVAVGDYAYGITAKPGPAYRDKTLAEQWNGHSWRLLPTANVSHNNQLTAVSCVSADDCTAVGTKARQYPLAEHWNGKTWRVEAMPTVSSIGYMELTSVSCPAAGFCVAAGDYQGQPVAQTWDGARWRITRLPQPPVDNHSARLNGISCASPATCVAVGVSGSAASYAELYSAGTWRLSITRNPL